VRDTLLFATMILAFATAVTAHVSIAVALASHAPRWRALVALVAIPLAPYWAFREGMHLRAVLWIASALTYAFARR